MFVFTFLLIRRIIVFFKRGMLSRHTLRGKTKGVCETPKRPVYPLNSATTYLGSQEEPQECISGFWSPLS